LLTALGCLDLGASYSQAADLQYEFLQKTTGGRLLWHLRNSLERFASGGLPSVEAGAGAGLAFLHHPRGAGGQSPEAKINNRAKEV
jgi:hypothetical protein